MICDLQEQLVARSKTIVPEALAKSAEVLCQIGQLFGLPLTLSVVAWMIFRTAVSSGVL